MISTWRFKQLGHQLPERSRQAGGVEGFDEALRRADFSSRSGPEEAA